MKTIVLLTIVLIGLSTSCKKHRTCVCETTSTVGGSTNTSTDNYLTPKLSKAEAEDWCKAQGQDYYEYGINDSRKVDCELE